MSKRQLSFDGLDRRDVPSDLLPNSLLTQNYVVFPWKPPQEYKIGSVVEPINNYNDLSKIVIIPFTPVTPVQALLKNGKLTVNFPPVNVP